MSPAKLKWEPLVLPSLGSYKRPFEPETGAPVTEHSPTK
jgi:hypothetical protein